MKLRSSWCRGYLLAAVGLWLASASGYSAVFTVTNTNDSGPGSLAQAITDANANLNNEVDTIAFNIPGPGVHVIPVTADDQLQVGGDLVIDGYTQPGAQPNTLAVGDNAIILIQIDGGGIASSISSGLQFGFGDCTVRGLSLTGFSVTDGVAISAVGNFIGLALSLNVEGCFVGLTPDGSASGSNVGIMAATLVGGATPDKRNIISANHTGVSNGGTVIGNYIGTDITGLGQSVGNFVGVSASQVGGPGEGEGNVITGNTYGVFGIDSTIQGNLIGPLADGSPGFGNQIGVRITVPSSTVGGLEEGEGNIIAYNGTGITLITASQFSGPPTGNSILSNLIFGNRIYGLDLGLTGPSPNDFQDGDSGENMLQNFPVIGSVTRDAGSTTVTGLLNSTPSSDFTLQFFAGEAESLAPAEILLGTKTVTTSASGNASFEFTFPIAITDDQAVTATATDAAGNTSEFFPQDGEGQLVNISTRGAVGAGDDALIAGFIMSSGSVSLSPTKTFLVRALGPSLGIAGALADPQLEIQGAAKASNDNWVDSDDFDAIATSGLAPHDPNEAAVILTVPTSNLATSSFTAVVTGADGGSGIASVEVYDLDRPQDPVNVSQLVNLSTRGAVGTGDNVLIGGVILRGDAPEKVLLRAIGPDLADNGVDDPLQDPALDLYDADGTLLLSNDDWQSDQADEITATGLAPNDDRDAAILATLFPTSYTAIVRGKNDTTGVALVEFYKLD